MNSDEFYKDKSVAETEWWLDSCNLPKLVWGRVRSFSDGTADACFIQGSKLYGFENREYAGYLLSEDEYIRFGMMNEEDEKEYEITLAAITLPIWEGQGEQEFEYLGTY